MDERNNQDPIGELSRSKKRMIAGFIIILALALGLAVFAFISRDYLHGFILLVMLAVATAVARYVTRQATGAVAYMLELQRQHRDSEEEVGFMEENLRQSLAHIERESSTIMEIHEKYTNSLEASNDAIWEINVATGSLFASDKWEEITGHAPGTSFNADAMFTYLFTEDRKQLLRIIAARKGSFNLQLRLKMGDGSTRWLHARGKWLDEDRMTGSLSDITQQKEAELYIEYIAYNDEITGLPNRAYFTKELERAYAKARSSGKSGCVVFIDLDNFKVINDSHGHNFGDKMLVEVGKRLIQVAGGCGSVARFSGDEFLILAEEMSEEDDILALAEKVRQAFISPIPLAGDSFFVTLSIGLGRFPQDGENVEELLKNVDAAMYESKAAGRNTSTFYRHDMSYKLERRNAIMDILRSAIEDGNVYLMFQPQIRQSTGRVVSCEALMRLRGNSATGFISPAEFIPIAEETRMIVPLGFWAMRKSIECWFELQKRGLELEGISVNVSEIQLRAPGFLDGVKNLLEEYDYDPHLLHLEVTESVLLDNVSDKVAMFDALRKIGVKIELDDFGTGYTSLNYVRMIPLDVIKIDKCFIDDIGKSEEKEALIGLIIGLAATFGASVVAEGVETAKQAEFLKTEGDVVIQGYYYSKPLEVGPLEEKIKSINHGFAASTPNRQGTALS